MSTSITLTSRRDNLTIGRWYWPSVGYELTFSQATLLNMLPQDVALLRSALSDGKLSSSAPLDAFLSGQVTASPLPATTTRASVDDSVGREVRAVVDDNDNISLVALGYGPIDVTPKDIQVTVINDLTTGGSLLPLSAEQGKILNDSKYTKPAGGIPSSDLSSSVKTSLDKANTALQVAPVASVAGKTGDIVLSKADVGLSDVDNTRDSAKPVSTLQAAAIAQAKAEAISGAPVRSVSNRTGDVTLGKSDVGLSNVDNTSDSNKPVSTAQAAAIAQAKSEAIASAPVQSVAGKTGAIALAKSDVGLSNVDNTSDLNKPLSTAASTALALKLDVSSKASDAEAKDLTNDVKYMTPAKVVKHLQKLGYVTPEMFASEDASTPGNNWYSIKAAVEFARANGIPVVKGASPSYTMNIPGSTGADKLLSLINATGVLVDLSGSKVFYNYGRAPLFYWYRNYTSGAGLRGHFVFTGPAIGHFNSTADLQPNAFAQAIGVPGATGAENALMLNRSGLWAIALGISSDNLYIDIDMESQTPCTISDVTGATCLGVSLGGHYDMGTVSTTWRSDWRNAVGNRVNIRAADCSFPLQFAGQTGLTAYVTARRRPGIVVSDQIGPGHVVYCGGLTVQSGVNVAVNNEQCDVTAIDVDDGAERNANNGQTFAPKGIVSSRIVVISKHSGGAIGSFGHICNNNTIDIHWSYEGTDLTGVYAIASSATQFKGNKVKAYLNCPNAPISANFGGTDDSTTGTGSGNDNDIELYAACDFNIPAGSPLGTSVGIISLCGSRNQVKATLRPTKPRDGGSSARCRALKITPGEDNSVEVRMVGPNISGDFIDIHRTWGTSNTFILSIDPQWGVISSHVNSRDGKGMVGLDLSSVSGVPVVGDTVTGASSGAKAVVAEVASASLVYCAQNDTTGYTKFTKGESASFATSGATAVLSPWGGGNWLTPVSQVRMSGIDSGGTSGLVNFRLPTPGVYDVEVELTNNGKTTRHIYGFRAVWGPNDSGASSLQAVGTPVTIGTGYLSGAPTFSVSTKGVVSVSYTKSASQFGRWGYSWTLKNTLI